MKKCLRWIIVSAVDKIGQDQTGIRQDRNNDTILSASNFRYKLQATDQCQFVPFQRLSIVLKKYVVFFVVQIAQRFWIFNKRFEWLKMTLTCTDFLIGEKILLRKIPRLLNNDNLSSIQKLPFVFKVGRFFVVKILHNSCQIFDSIFLQYFGRILLHAI